MEEQNDSVTGLTWVKETFMLQGSLVEANKLEQEDSNLGTTIERGEKKDSRFC